MDQLTHRCGECLHYRRCWYENAAHEDDGACLDFESELGDETWWPPETNKIYCGDAQKMDKIPNDTVDLIITSPPYNAKIDYDMYDDDLPLADYLAMLENVWRECRRVLKKGGRICINVANLFRSPYIPLTSYITHQMLQLGFLMRGEIVWIKANNNGVGTAWGSFKSPSNPCLRGGHEYILIFSKDEYALQYKGKTDLTKKEFELYTRDEWTFSPIHTSQKLGHPVPFPPELPRRLIKLYSWQGAIVLDPFCGSGTTCYMAKILGRRYLGYDLSPAYCETARRRCQQTTLDKAVKK